MVAAKLAIALHVADHRFYRAAPFQLLFHLRRQTAFTATHQNLWYFQPVTTITAINKTPLNRPAGDSLNLANGPAQSMTIIRITWFRQHAHHKVVAVAHRYAHLNPKVVLLVCLALADAFHFRRMQAVKLVLVLPLLSQQTISQAKL